AHGDRDPPRAPELDGPQHVRRPGSLPAFRETGCEARRRCSLKRSIPLLVATFTSACASSEPQPGLRPTPTTPRPSAAIVGSGTAGEAPREVVKALTIGEALKLADRYHPYMALARAEIEAHEGRLVQAGLFPSTA